ncbi:unnamed protein product [Linum trigynum]|uniref:Uncharacterized protein n=1 Tax=Linum trigynum TaxID=586398 RepID=A0AAV2FR47_9ROSI
MMSDTISFHEPCKNHKITSYSLRHFNPSHSATAPALSSATEAHTTADKNVGSCLEELASTPVHPSAAAESPPT